MVQKRSGIPSKRVISAGGVVYRRNGLMGPDIVLCGRREPSRWSLPKGRPDSGETIIETALREAKEETGLNVEIERPLGSVNYWFVSSIDRVKYNKTVHFFLMNVLGGSTANHDVEFDDVVWFSAEEAVRRLTFENEMEILVKALEFIEEGYLKV
jgi:8-oxo-dGTP pyrophosphatase MutT (NUDIX family)